MKFTKMHGTGNDYVYINCFEESVPADPSSLARWVSHRHFGIGADGLILIKPSDGATDATMEVYNADGSTAEMCGNGLRCVAKYVYDNGISKKERLRIQTGAGPRDVRIVKADGGRATQLQIDMGVPILRGSDIPTVWDDERVVNRSIRVGEETLDVTAVGMGNPHCVVFVDNVDDYPVSTMGSLLETSAYFPNRVNVEFVQVLSGDEVVQRTWERGAGETWACGTGAAAVCVAGVITERTHRNLVVHLKGGDLTLSFIEGGPVLLTGPAQEVFRGEMAE